MRILHISKYYFPYVGGIENTCRQLTELTPNAETAVVCFNEGRKDSVEVVNGIKVYRVGSWINISRQALSPTYFFVLKRALKEFEPDIIHFHWANPFPAAVLLTMIPKKVKLLVHYHMDIINQKKIYPFIKPIEKKLLKRADRIIVTSPNYREGSEPLIPFKSKIRIREFNLYHHIPALVTIRVLDLTDKIFDSLFLWKCTVNMNISDIHKIFTPHGSYIHRFHLFQRHQ